jgi:hypothetical protein
MKKKISPLITAGTCLVAIGVLLNVLLPRFTDWEISWVSIPILVLAIILLFIGLYTTKK